MSKLILGAEVYSVINAALEVLKKLGHGFHEKPYERALVVELSLRGMSCQQQRCFNVVYKGTKVGEYIPDLIVDGTIIIDPKVILPASLYLDGNIIGGKPDVCRDNWKGVAGDRSLHGDWQTRADQI